MPELSIRLLGPLQVALDEESVVGFRYDKVRALLAYLAVEAESPHRRETLAALFWPDQSPKLARQSLRQSLSTLRRAIKDQDRTPPFLLVEGDTIQFHQNGETWLDVNAFNGHLAKANGHIHPYSDIEGCQICIRYLEDAAALYRGGFLQDVLISDSAEFESWVMIHRERLRMQALTALHHITRHYLRQGKYAHSQSYALRQVEMEPYREEAHRQLMHVLARTGQRSAALSQYETLRRILVEELGMEPSHETQALYARIRLAGEARPHNLPAQLTPLIGRDGELQYIAEHLADPVCRLLTLTGPGGIGKTRLALQAATEHLGVYLNGVYFLPLGALSAARFLASAIADGLGFSLSGTDDPEAELLDYLRGKEMLLVLDGIEHLHLHLHRDEGPNLLLEILRHAPLVKILATSRGRLMFQAEWVFRVPGLPFPEEPDAEGAEGYSGVKLFFERARRVERSFSLQTAPAEAVVRICQLVEGMPLAIELAAASVSAFSCDQIVTQIECNLDALATGMQDLPERHRSMRAVFEHSWKLLSEEEQLVFRRLSVFRGGFESQAAQEVARGSPWTIPALASKSLLRKSPSDRYDMHELLRQYGAEKLATDPLDEEITFERYCEYYGSYLHRQELALKAGQQREALAAIGTEVENVRAAFQWAVANGKLKPIELSLDGLYYLYWARNWFAEGKRIFEQAEKAALASAQGGAGSRRLWKAALQGDEETGLAAVEEEDLLLARIWTRQAEFDGWLGHYGEAIGRLEKSIDICRALEAQDELALALELLGRITYWQSEYVKAGACFRESLAIYRQIGDQVGTAQALNSLANTVCDELADYDQARVYYLESLGIARQIGDRFGEAKVLVNMGVMAQQLGDYEEAKQLYQDSLDIYREIDYRNGQSASLVYLAQIARLLGEHGSAKGLLQASLDLNRNTGNRRAIADALNQLGQVELAMGDPQGSKKHLVNGLNLATEIGASQLALDALIGMAKLLQTQGETERALELLTAVVNHAAAGQELQDRGRDILAECEAALAPQVVGKYRGQANPRALTEIVALALGE